MKPKFNRLLVLGIALVTAPFTHADTYYWDDNAAAANFGTAGASAGTWAAPTAGTVAGWSLSPTGADAFASFTTGTADDLNFGTNTATFGLAAGSITVSGTVNAGTITYGSQSGAIGLTGGTIGFGAAPTITTNAAVGTINSIASTLSGAGTSFTKAGVGSLAFTSTNTSFNPGSIAITGGDFYIGNNTATQLNAGNYAGSISIASGSNLNVWTTSNQTFSTGVISGAGNLVKSYGNTLTLTGLNTYTGKTSITPQTTAGGGLSVSSFDYITSGTYANHGLGSNLGAPTTVANGTISIGSTGKQAPCNLTYTGAGETTDRRLQINLNGTAGQTLNANNSAGLLKFTSDVLVSGGVSGSLTLGGALSTSAGEISGKIPALGTSTGKVVINATGVGASWTLSGDNIGLTTGVTLTAGKLNVNSATALGATAGTFTLGAGTLDNTSGGPITLTANNPIAWNGDNTWAGTNNLNLGTGAVTLGGNRAPVIQAGGGGVLTIGGVVGGGFGITVGGGGTMALTNEASTYTGKTVIGNNAASTLKLQVSKLADLSATSSLGAPTTAGNGLIQLGATSNSSTLELIGSTAASSTNRQIQIGSTSGSGAGFILNNNTNSANTLTFSNAAFNVAVANNGFNRILRLGGSNAGNNTISGAIIPNTGSGVTSVVKQDAGTWVINGAISLNSGITVSSGTLVLGNAGNTYVGNTNINAGTLQITVNNALPSGSGVGNAVINGGASSAGTLDLNGFDLAINGLSGTTNTVLGKVVNNATGTNKTLQVGNNDATTAFAGVIADNTSGTGTVTLNKTGTGTLTLSGPNTYTGTTTVNAGTLALGANDVLPNASNISLGAATLDAATFTDTVGTLATTGAAIINLGSGGALAFADSSAVTWTGSLDITGTFVAGSSIRFGNTSGGLTSGQLATITVGGIGAGTYSLDSNGYLTTGGPGPVTHFDISAIGSPQTVGTAITGITLTAKDASDAVATGFIGTVTFGGTGGFTGTSGTFTAGVLNSVSVTPTNAGTSLTFTVDDGASHTGTTTITTIQTQYNAWSGGAGFAVDANSDGIKNGIAWVLGAADPSVSALGLLPTEDTTSDPDYLIFTYRRLDTAVSAGTTINAAYGSTLTGWTTAVHDGTNIIITTTDNFYSASPGVDKVEVKIKKTLAIDGKLFARLEANLMP